MKGFHSMFLGAMVAFRIEIFDYQSNMNLKITHTTQNPIFHHSIIQWRAHRLDFHRD